MGDRREPKGENPAMSRTAPTLADALEDPASRRATVLARIALALAVVASHAAPIRLGPGAEEPLEAVFGLSLGRMAVAGFLALSGVLVARSLARRDILTFASARAARLAPGLWAALGVTALWGVAMTDLSTAGFFSDPGLARFVIGHALLAPQTYELPGVLGDAAYPAANGSLWSLRYEAIAYGALLLAALAAGRARAALLIAAGAPGLAALAWAASAGLVDSRLRDGAELLFAFALGCAAYAARAHLRFGGSAGFRMGFAPVAICAAGAAMAAEADPALARVLATAAAAWVTIWASFAGPRPRPAGRIGDPSYGAYLYAFPIQQSLVALAPDLGAGAHIALAAALSLAAGALSWRLVEQPAARRAAIWTSRFQAARRVSPAAPPKAAPR